MSLRSRQAEGGFTLFLALFAILFLSGYILVNTNVEADRRERQRAYETAWLVDQIANAARLYVRDQALNAASPFARTALCAAPQNITPAVLRSGGYLRDTVGQLTGSDYTTPLGQTVRITAALSDLSAGCGSVDTLASTAYIILEPGPRTTPQSLLYLTEALNNRSLSVILPRFSAAGANQSPTCNGTPGTIQWDTGCLNNTQYARISGGNPFAANTIGLPVWLTFRGDNRAIFRYAQPENPLAQTMATDLAMAPTGSGYASLNYTTVNAAAVAGNPLATTQVASGVRQVMNDTASVDNRFNVKNISNLTVDRIIIDPQAQDRSTIDPIESASDRALNVTGTTVIGSAAQPANVRSFAQTSPSLTTGAVTLGGTAPGIAVLPRNGGIAQTMAVTGAVTTNGLQATQGNVSTVTNASGQTSVSNRITFSSANFGGGQGVVANSMSGNALRMDVGGNATISGTAQSTNSTVTGGGSLSFATARLDAQTINTQGTMTIGGDLSSGGNTNIGSISQIGTCYGDCPDRSVITPPIEGTE